MEVWEDEKCCGNTSRIPQLFRRLVFPQHFRVLSNFHELTKSKDYRDIWLSSDCASFRHRSVKYLRFSVNIAERFRTWKHSFTIIIICSWRLFALIVSASSQTAPGQKKIDHRFLWTGFFPLQTCDWIIIFLGERGHQNKSGLVHDRVINANDWNVNNKERRTTISRTLTFLALP